MKHTRWIALILALLMLLPLAACSRLKPAARLETLDSCDSVVRGSGNKIEAKTPLAESENGYMLRLKGFSFRGDRKSTRLNSSH